MSREFEVKYAGSARGLRVRLIRIWERGDIPARVMSTSSGPKAYIKNQVYDLFERMPAVCKVIMVCGVRTPFVLIFNGAEYFDMSSPGRRVEVRELSQ